VLISINVIPSLGLKLKLPQSSRVVDSHPPVRVQVALPAEGPLMVDGMAIVDMKALGEELSRRKLTAKNGIAVVINGDESAPMQRLVDVMDVLKAQGIDAMTISAKRK
jgi:biopolymer transport protein ExbD